MIKATERFWCLAALLWVPVWRHCLCCAANSELSLLGSSVRFATLQNFSVILKHAVWWRYSSRFVRNSMVLENVMTVPYQEIIFFHGTRRFINLLVQSCKFLSSRESSFHLTLFLRLLFQYYTLFTFSELHFIYFSFSFMSAQGCACLVFLAAWVGKHIEIRVRLYMP